MSKTIIPLLLSLYLFFLPPAYAITPDTGEAEYWIKKYGLIKPDPETKRVNQIFKDLLQAADKKKGVDPKLYIINNEGTPWAHALYDGSIILTKNAIEFCYRKKESSTKNDRGDARIAFILGHELAHQVAGDFWHYAFFQAAKAEEENNPLFKNSLTELSRIVKDSENFITKEIRADQMGIIYASIAGFRTDLLFKGADNFFMEFAKALDIKSSSNHPTPGQRAAAAITRLKAVSSKLPLFKLGIYTLGLGWHTDAIELLEAFKSTYPGKEVYNNLGAAYLQGAIKEYLSSKGEHSFPFKLSIAIDSVTTAENIPVRTRGISADKYKKMIGPAIENLKKAGNSDPAYSPAKNNLGAAYILEGRYHDAIGQFNANLKTPPDEWETLNNRGVAYYYLGKELDMPIGKKSEEDFKKAVLVSPEAAIPVFNLSVLYNKIGQSRESQKAFKRYSGMVNRIGSFLDGIDEEDTKKLIVKQLGFGTGKPLPATILNDIKWAKVYGNQVISVYNNLAKETSLLIKNNIVRLIITNNISFAQEALSDRYGEPDRKIVTSLKEIWLYKTGIGFEVVGGMVKTGVLF